MKMTTVWCAIIAATMLDAAASGAELPDVRPPFHASQTLRQNFVLYTSTVLDQNGKSCSQPRFEAGNKQLVFLYDIARRFFDNPAKLTLIRNREPVAEIHLNGWIPEIGGGTPFKGKDNTKGTLNADEKAGSVTFEKEYYYAAEKTARFRYTLRNSGEGKLNLAWELGLSPEATATLPMRSDLAFSITFPANSGHTGLRFNGKAVPKLTPEALTALNEGDKKEVLVNSDGGILSICSEGDEEGISIHFGPEYQIVITESRKKEGHSESYIRILTKKILTAGSLVIDLGTTSANDQDAPPPVAGVDFWKHDRKHVPLSPTRNLLPNPGFEQGLRYWTWLVRGGGGEYKTDPKTPPCYELSATAHTGQRSLKINATHGNRSATSLCLPLVPGKTYTASFYSKGASVRLSRIPALPESGKYDDFVASVKSPATADWQRTSLTFTAKLPAEQLELAAWAAAYVDSLQLEEGEQATEYIAPQVEGAFTTADPDNSLSAGQALNAELTLSGQPNLEGIARLAILNCYRETIYTKEFPFRLDQSGVARVAVNLPEQEIGTGIFIVRTDYLLNGGFYATDYARFSILRFLENRHPTKNIFGAQINHAEIITRGDDMGRMYQRWGFGSVSYGGKVMNPEFFARYGLSNLLNNCSPAAFSPKWLKQPFRDIFYAWEEMTPEREKIIEDIAYNSAADPTMTGDVWSFNTESEGHTRMALLNRWDEFIKLQMAAARGFKRARPQAVCLPDGGTSGFQPNRGYAELEKELKASQGRVVWDGLAIHPYGLHDEIDAAIGHLAALAKQYQPDVATKLFIPECSSDGYLNVPEWERINQWYEGRSGLPGYDTGWKEFVHAGISARMYLIGLKYWPQLQNVNLWIFRPFIDMNFSPLLVCGATNALGNLFANPRFVADYEPVSGVRGLVFTDEQDRGLAAVWSNSLPVENGVIRAPQLILSPAEMTLEFIDLMGNSRQPNIVNGKMVLPLSPAPIYLRTAPGQTAKLTTLLQQATVLGSDKAASIKCLPDATGRMEVEVTNQTRSQLTGSLNAGSGEKTFSIPSKEKIVLALTQSLGTQPGKLFDWEQTINFSLSNGFQSTTPVRMSWFYVPHTDAPLPADPADTHWKAIPAIRLVNMHKEREVSGGHAGDLAAEFRMAWDKENLYLHVEAADDKFLPDPEGWGKNLKRTQTLYNYDGALEVYFDTFSDGRFNGIQGYDNNDYRYDFYASDGKAESGSVRAHRMHEVFTEYAGGPSMPTVEEVQSGGLPGVFRRTGNRYAYVVIFPQRYLLPLRLQEGARCGFGLYLHDRDEPGKFKGLSLVKEAGASCNQRPDLWPVMLLGK